MRSEQEIDASGHVVLTSDLSESTDTDEENDMEYVRVVHKSPAGPALKRAKMKIMSAGLASVLDRTKISSRKATLIISEVASSLCHDVNSLNINRSSIHWARANFRAATASKLRFEFSVSSPLTVHWDGKLMENLTANKHVDRLPVLITGVGVEQLLGVQKLTSGTGEAQAAAVTQCLEEWEIAERVVALCFDTTASNTGHRSDACCLIEQKLGKDLLYLACRHCRRCCREIVDWSFHWTRNSSLQEIQGKVAVYEL